MCWWLTIFLPCFCGVTGLVFILFGLPTHFVYLFVADHLWRYANDVFLWPASRDGSGIRCQDRMVLSSWSAHPHTRSLHSSAAALPSGRVARSCQPILSLTPLNTQKHFSHNIVFKGEVLCALNFSISSPLSTWTEQFVKGPLRKREISTWFIRALGNFIVF